MDPRVFRANGANRANVVLPQQLQKSFIISTGVDKAGTVVLIIRTARRGNLSN
jgi:hypothetical protein